MRIYDVSCNAYSDKRNYPTFGFWQPSMGPVEKGIQSFNSIYKHKTIKAPKDGVWLKGKTGETLNTFGLDMYNAM